MKKERNLILLQEEMLWLHKSFVEWLKSGDNNTKFFHTSTVVRRRRYKIHMLLDDEGRRVEGNEKLKEMAVAFYSNLFWSKDHRRSDFFRGGFPNLDMAREEVWRLEWRRR